MRTRFFFGLMLSVLLSVACQKTEPEPASDSTTGTAQSATTATTASTAAEDVTPMTGQTWIEDVTIEMGSDVGPGGALVAGTASNDFKAGQPVVVSMHVATAPANTTVKVSWVGPNGTTIGEESKTTAADQKYLTFSRTDTKSWAKGDYRAEYWFGDKKVGIDDFKII